MKRYILFNDGSPIREQESPDGDWVPWAECEKAMVEKWWIDLLKAALIGLKIGVCVWIIAACSKYVFS